ncbi:MAG: cytochrome c biogenesis protein CcsA [Flavitalea sp.]
MNYIGEHLLPGQLGNFFLFLSFVASLVATIAYAKSANSTLQEDADSWKKIARVAFILDAISVAVVFGTIYYIISNHYFEYYYAWNHSDVSLRPKYLISSIWEGQEGSFLLWAIWHAVLGLILIKTAGKWEAPVMAVISFAQVCIGVIVLGIHIGELKIGSNPFLLTRHMFPDAPIFQTADYVSKLKDGNGLNQLLQNYWMVIHPPVLFLGFASVIVPFSFAIAGLWKKDYGGWTKKALPWALFSAGILGLGIMMGAKWAYESLNFGGYWAWDPVENASLVPWLILVAGIHTQVIYNSTGHSLRATYFFHIISFVLILYSTYLTRSGDLQDTSVHSFTGSDMTWLLRGFVLLFLVPSIILYIRRYREIPHIVKEENTYSREFWMFIGSLVIFLSALFIILFTSLPVINKIFGSNFTVGAEVEFFYNRIQIFVAIVLGMLTAVTQYLKYKDTSKAYFGKKIFIPTIIAVLISLAISIFGNIDYDNFGIGFLAAIHLAIFASVYTIIGNAGYIWTGLSGKLKAAGASVAHVGFGMMMVGILISSAKKDVLSINRVNPLNFGSESKEKGNENLTLFKGVRTDMGKYWATYATDSSEDKGKKMLFHVLMEKKDGSEKFSLYPDLIKNTKGQEGFSNNPDSKHYWNRDIFSYISYADKLDEGEDTTQFKSTSVKVGDTLYYSAGYMTLDKVTLNPNEGKYKFSEKDTALMAQVTIRGVDGTTYIAKPVYYVENNQSKFIMDTVFSQGLAIGMSRVVDKEHVEISVKESSRLAPFVALKVLQFPFINLLWLGTVVMIVGFGMAAYRRARR